MHQTMLSDKNLTCPAPSVPPFAPCTAIFLAFCAQLSALFPVHFSAAMQSHFRDARRHTVHSQPLPDFHSRWPPNCTVRCDCRFFLSPAAPFRRHVTLVNVAASRPPSLTLWLAALAAKPIPRATRFTRAARRAASCLMCFGTLCSSTAALASSSTSAFTRTSASLSGLPRESRNCSASSVPLCAGIHLTTSSAPPPSKYGNTAFHNLAPALPWCVARFTPPRSVCSTDKQSTVAVVPIKSTALTAIMSAHASVFGTESTHQGGTPFAAATTSAVPGCTAANAHPVRPSLPGPSSSDASEYTSPTMLPSPPVRLVQWKVASCDGGGTSATADLSSALSHSARFTSVPCSQWFNHSD